MKIYQCDNTWKYLYEADADQSPLEPGKYIVPAYAVTVKPDTSKGIPIWNLSKKAWEYFENHIGLTVYSTSTKLPLTITALGPIPTGYTTQVPREFDSWDGQLWITDMVLRNAALKQRKMEAINIDFETAMSSIRATYPESEVMSWSKQELEARNYLLNKEYSTPLIDLIAAARGIDKDTLVDKVILKADQYAFATGTAVGRRQQLEDQVSAIEIGQETKLDQIKF